MNIEEIRKKALDFIKINSISQASLSRSIGVNVGAFNSFLKGKYQGDNETIAKDLNSYIENYSKKTKSCKDEVFIKTKDSKMVDFVISMAVDEREMAIIYGMPGTGKTMAVKEYASNHPEAILIEADVYTNTRNFFNDLMDRLGITVKHCDIHSKLVDVCAELKRRDTIIIIDEAEHLPVKCLEMIRRIWDYTKVPIILAGTHILVKNLMGKNGELAQLYSRIGGKWIMKGLQDEDREKIFGEHSKLIEEICGVNFRSSKKLFSRATKLAELSEVELDDSVFKEASEMLVLL